MMNRRLPERQRAFQPEGTAFAKHWRHRTAQPLGKLQVLWVGSQQAKN